MSIYRLYASISLRLSFSGIEGMTELNGREFLVEYENYEKFRILEDTTNWLNVIPTNIQFIPKDLNGEVLIDTRNITNMQYAFVQRDNLVTIPELDLRSVIISFLPFGIVFILEISISP